jgi:hypothetical protein
MTGPIGCPETSVRIYHSTLRNTPEQRKYLHQTSYKFDYFCLFILNCATDKYVYKILKITVQYHMALHLVILYH